MDVIQLAKEQGLAFVFAVILLKFLYDAIYVRLPRGFTMVHQELTSQRQRADQRHEEHVALQREMMSEIHALKLAAQPARPRRRRSRPRK